MLRKTLNSAALFCMFTCGSTAGNLVIDYTQSELSATMHASPSHTFTSTAETFECAIQLDPTDLSITEAQCSFRFNDLDSGKTSRDTKMCKWMDIDTHPIAVFRLTRIGTDEATGEQVAWGSFTMHHLTHEISIPYSITRKGEHVVIEGQTEIDHRKWGLEPVRLLFFSVDPVLKPHFRLVGKLQNDD